MRSTLTTLESSSETAQLVKPGAPLFTMKPVPAPKELGKGSLDFEVTLARDVLPGSRSGGEPTKKDAKAKTPSLAPLKLAHVGRPRSSANLDCAGRRPRQAREDDARLAPGCPRVRHLGYAARSGHPQERQVRREQLLYARVALAFLGQRHRLPDEGAARKMQETRSMLSATPNKGRAPLFLTTEVAPTDGMAYTLRVDVPKGYIEDAIILIASSSLAALARP